jgi:DNA-binding transcriptional regulator YiaG
MNNEQHSPQLVTDFNAARIRRIRRYSHLNQTEFGDLCGVCKMTVYFWERGLRLPVSMCIITKLFELERRYVPAATE